MVCQLIVRNIRVSAENWPPNSPDLDPVCYLIWGAVQKLVYHCCIRDVERLKQVRQPCWCWEQIGQDIIDCTIGQFHKQLSLVYCSNWMTHTVLL